MTRSVAIVGILFLGAFAADCDESDREDHPEAWDGTAHIAGDDLSIVVTNNSADCAYVRIGSLSEKLVTLQPQGSNSPPHLRLDCFYVVSDYTVKILWPVKRGTKLVTGKEMMRLSINSETICDLVREHGIPNIEVVLSVMDLPLTEGAVRARQQIVRCQVRTEDPQK